MTDFRLLHDTDFNDFINIAMNAYTGSLVRTTENINKMKEKYKSQYENDYINLYGAYREEKMVGGMKLHDFKMNLLSKTTMAGGLGSVAVDFLHKKEKIAKDLVTYTLEHFKDKGYPMVMLYAFRPDFYKNMGFGYGTKINQYRIKPNDIIGKGKKDNIRFASIDDKVQLVECYNKCIRSVNGMIYKRDIDFDATLNDDEKRTVVLEENKRIKGYIIFSFKKVYEDNFLINDMYIDEFIYQDRSVLREMMIFLKSQSDQIREIVINTQQEDFHYLLNDVRSRSNNIIPHVFHQSNVQGVGFMYRVIDIKALFNILKTHNFGSSTFKLKLSIKDNLMENNNKNFVLDFNEGKANVLEVNDSYDVEIDMDISEFSSMVMGVVGFKKLYNYSLADISDTNYIDIIDRTFKAEDKPMCITRF